MLVSEKQPNRNGMQQQSECSAAPSMCRGLTLGGDFRTVHQDHLHGSPPSQRANELKDRDRREDSSVMNQSGRGGGV